MGGMRLLLFKITELSSKRCPGIGFFSRVGREIGVFWHVTIVKAMIFPVVRYRYESWTGKKAEC